MVVFMKKVLLIFFILLLFFFYNKDKEVMVFSYMEDEVFDNYYIKFKDCDLNTNNFIENFSFLKNKDFKILEIIPEKTLDEKYLFYSNNLERILDEFKNKYINSMINESKYTTNICIKEIA
jgi:hypothetical protein